MFGGGDGEDELQFEVSIVDANDPIQSGGVLEVIVVVENVGGSGGSDEIALNVGSIQKSTEVSLEPEESTEISFSGRLEIDSAEETLDAVVESTAFSDIQRVTVQSPARYELEITNITQELIKGERFQVEVEVSNTGATRATKAVWLTSPEIDEELDRTQATVDGGRSETVTLSWDTTQQSEFSTVTVQTEDDQITQSISLLAPPELELLVQGTNAPVVDEETLEVEIRVANQGDVEVSEVVTLTLGGSEVDSQEITARGGTQQSVTLSYTPTIDDVGERELTVAVGDLSESVSITINQALELVGSSVIETEEDFAELMELTVQNRATSERSAVAEGTIDRQEYSIGVTFGDRDGEINIPAGTDTNTRPVTVPAESEETFILKIPTGVWEFDGSTKFAGSDVNINYTQEAELLFDESLDDGLEPYERVSVSSKNVEFGSSGVREFDVEVENFTDQTVDITVIGLVEDVGVENSEAVYREEVRVVRNSSTDLSFSLSTTQLQNPGWSFVEIEGVRENPGTTPGFTTLS
jgi:hypothetical protein